MFCFPHDRNVALSIGEKDLIGKYIDSLYSRASSLTINCYSVCDLEWNSRHWSNTDLS